MKYMTPLRCCLLITLSLLFLTSCSQKPTRAFYDDIHAFKQGDKTNPPPQNAIVFVGSSSFTMWQDVRSYFPGYTIINRGFGGSGLNDAIEYEDDIIVPYHPKQVVIYSGENDVATGTVTDQQVFERFKKLFEMLRRDLPQASIVYISMKPSPSRKEYMPIIVSANSMIRDYLTTKKNTQFVDVYSRMLDSTGYPVGEIFREDSLHMNAKGYGIWKEAIQPVLLR
jgi:lysophospholipase L1-like esterase